MIESFKTVLNLDLTPGGIWTLNSEGRKQAIDSRRVDNLSWDSYKEDNMARLFLHKDSNILVLDVDGEEVYFTQDTIEIPALNITLPLSFYTQTTQPGKYHIYYRGDTANLPNRVIGLNGTKVDVLTYGVVFEWHSFSPYNKLFPRKVEKIPPSLIDILDELELPTQNNQELGLTSNLQRLNLVKAFLNDELDTNKQWNSFFRIVMPQEYLDKSKKKITIDQFKLSYDLVNKIAVKLCTTSELDFNEHTVPTLHKLLTMWGIDPLSKKSQQLMGQNILPSLPQHESIMNFDPEEVKEFQSLLTAQSDTTTPLFRTIVRGALRYVQIDKYSLSPIETGGGFFLEERAAQALHPERNIVNEEGRVVGWDGNVPMVYTINNPYKPSYEWCQKSSRHYINLYSPTQYIEKVQNRQVDLTQNIIYKVVKSTIGLQYLDLYLAYSAQVVFGHSSPTLVLWMAALKTELGGSGKSLVTLELFSLILGSAATSVDIKTVMSGWGDIVSATKILSLEDKPDQSAREWEATYANIKQQNTNSYRKLNMKGAGVTSERISVAITGSTNYRLKLSPSDRRFLCLEPAHLHGYTEPLTDEERLQIAKLLSSHDYSQEVQDYVDYLYHIFNKGFSPEIEKALFIEAPSTIYRSRWVGEGESNSQNLLYNLSEAEELMSLLKFDEVSRSHIADLLSMIILAHNEATQKSAVSWKWFEEMLPYILSDKYAVQRFSKANIAQMLHIDFKYVGDYAKVWRDHLPYTLPPEWARWPMEGHMFILNDEQRQKYISVIEELR